MTKLLTSPWITAAVGTMVYLGSTFMLWKMPAMPQQPVKVGEQTVLNGPSWEFSNPEADQLIADLREQQKALDARQKQLDEWQQSLEAQKQQLMTVTQAVMQLQTDFDKSVVRVTEVEASNLKKLAKVFADMKPDNATTILEQKDDVEIVKIMLFMKENETAAILEIMAKQGPEQAKRAALISEHMRLSIPNATPGK